MSIKTIRSGATQHSEDLLDFLMSRIVSVSGVTKLGGSNMLVEQQTVPNMTVKVNMGYAMLMVSDGSKVYPVRIDTSAENVTITANASGNSRIDAIVLYQDLGASPNATATNVAKLIAIAGTPAGSPVAPLDATIQATIGASNPFIRLANVTVASGAVSIVTANITDTRVRATMPKVRKDYYVLTDGATIAIDYENGSKQQVTLGGNRTISAPTNMQAGDELWLKLIQDGTGTRVPVWFANIDWQDADTAITLTTTINHADIVGIIKKSDGRYEGMVVAQDFVIA